jgi:hypothetical protein
MTKKEILIILELENHAIKKKEIASPCRRCTISLSIICGVKMTKTKNRKYLGLALKM